MRIMMYEYDDNVWVWRKYKHFMMIYQHNEYIKVWWWYMSMIIIYERNDDVRSSKYKDNVGVWRRCMSLMTMMYEYDADIWIWWRCKSLMKMCGAIYPHCTFNKRFIYEIIIARNYDTKRPLKPYDLTPCHFFFKVLWNLVFT